MKQLLLFACLLCSFLASAQVKRYDVIITEIMADPSPQVGLPNAEYLEIKNVSASPIDIFGWKLSDATSTATVGVHYLLLPDSLLILCANGNSSALSAHGKAIGISSFPSLDNAGDLLSLKNPLHQVIHAVEYDLGWYRTESKKQGGWSLEMIDHNNPCSGINNWKASIHAQGGTPGKANSVAGANADDKPPVLLRTWSPDSLSLMLLFNETVDSTSASMISGYKMAGISVMSANAVPPLFTTVLLKLSVAMQREQVYLLSAEGVKDCKGNSSEPVNKVNCGLPSLVKKEDVVINEILFDPRSGAYDYVEIMNRSNKVIDLNAIYLANRDLNGSPSTLKKLVEKPVYIFPGEYRVITEDPTNLSLHYLVKEAKDILEIPQLPSYPDEEGYVLLMDQQGNIIDEVHYLDDWHFGLIANAEGISLERIDPSISSVNKDNWHSAASTAGYGTPGYENSQHRSAEDFEAAIYISPPLFSPDNDGFDDVLTIAYQLEEQGFVASITVFDLAGRPVRYLVKNHLLAFKGKWTWDGLDEKKEKLMMGTYIVFIEIFNLKGKKKIFKERVVLARRG